MKKYYISYTAKTKNSLEIFHIIFATSIGHAYRVLCESTTHEYFQDTMPSSDEDALFRIRKGKNCSVNVCFQLPEGIQYDTEEDISALITNSNLEEFRNLFEESADKIVRTGISNHYPKALREVLHAAERSI